MTSLLFTQFICNTMNKSLYPFQLLCLCSLPLLTACLSTVAPHQALSDAQQALASAKMVLPKKAKPSEEYILAEGLLNDGIKALKEEKYNVANTLFDASKRHAQAILMQQKPKSAKTGSSKK